MLVDVWVVDSDVAIGLHDAQIVVCGKVELESLGGDGMEGAHPAFTARWVVALTVRDAAVVDIARGVLGHNCPHIKVQRRRRRR